MFEKLKWVKGPFGNVYLEFYDGYTWWPVELDDPVLGGVIGFKYDSITSLENYIEQTRSATPSRGEPR